MGEISTNKDLYLHDLLPKQRNRMLRDRGHNFILPGVKTKRFKNTVTL